MLEKELGNPNQARLGGFSSRQEVSQTLSMELHRTGLFYVFLPCLVGCVPQWPMPIILQRQ